MSSGAEEMPKVRAAPFQGLQPVLIRPMPPPVFHVASHSAEAQRQRHHT